MIAALLTGWAKEVVPNKHRIEKERRCFSITADENYRPAKVT